MKKKVYLLELILKKKKKKMTKPVSSEYIYFNFRYLLLRRGFLLSASEFFLLVLRS
jgi:hypothetical protein